MSLKVIGAGFPRTGTISQKLALEQLGFGPCYHMSELHQRPEHMPLWTAAALGEAVDWDAIFAGWGSTTDAPGCAFYRQLAEVYPDARVILSVRDEEAWFASTQNTILSDGALRLFGQGDNTMIDAIGWGTDPRLRDHDYMIARYRRHVDEVREAIAPERLLVFDVAEGWAPLCRFLGVPEPEGPFPKVNTTDEFKAMMAARLQAVG